MKQNEEQSARIAELSAEITSLNPDHPRTERAVKQKTQKTVPSHLYLTDLRSMIVKHKQHQLSLEIMYGLVAELLFYRALPSGIML